MRAMLRLSLAAALLLPAVVCNRPVASAAAAPEDGIKVITDIPYTHDADPNRMLDLYLPEKAHGRLPVVILIHGGGWNAGDKKDFGGVCRDFVHRGYAAASLNYRLSHQAIFPAQAIDCKAAIRWLRVHARQYGLDPRRFVVGGHSAGGHLAAFLGVTNGDRQFDEGESLGVSSSVQAVLWFAGVSDFVARVRTPGYESEANPGSGQSMLIGGPVLEHQDLAMKASPISYVSGKAAPFDIFHGDSDHLVPVAQAQEMYDVLRKAGVYAELHILPGADHGGPGYFSLPMMTEIDSFLVRVLKLPSRREDTSLPGKGPYGLTPVSAPDLALDSSGPAPGGPGASVPNAVGIGAPNGSPSQQWIFTPHGDGYYVIHPADRPTLALTVADAGTTDGTRVILAPDSGSDSQTWLLFRDVNTGICALSPRCSPNTVLEDFSGQDSPAARIDLWTYNGSDRHLQWKIEPAGERQR